MDVVTVVGIFITQTPHFHGAISAGPAVWSDGIVQELQKRSQSHSESVSTGEWIDT